MKGVKIATEKIPLVHPGEVLYEDWLIPLGMSQSQLAKSMRVHPARIHEIVRGKRAITAETALRLARAVGTSPEFWLRLQMVYDLRQAQVTYAEIISREVIPIVV
ncbi:MAG TPA: HigA family addiction module antitoxin [Anaerolineales bacterium]|nr:HigA family addiction module antitoxin [Anaerolineales bacterium]